MTRGSSWSTSAAVRCQTSSSSETRAGRADDRRIGLHVLRGLVAVHRAGVVHRDVKPANILVADDGSIFLVDFGIARIAGDASLTGAVDRGHAGLPRAGAAAARTGRLPPTSGRSASLFYALEGYSPFWPNGERSPEAIVGAILSADPPRPIRQGKLAEVILRLLRKDPAKRAGAGELTAVLQSILSTAPAPGPWRRPGPACDRAGAGRPDQPR